MSDGYGGGVTAAVEIEVASCGFYQIGDRLEAVSQCLLESGITFRCSVVNCRQEVFGSVAPQD